MTLPRALSVLIPTFQRRDSLQRLLLALTRQTLPSEQFEVIAAVDGSTDGTADMLERFGAPFHLKWIVTKNRGRAAACNTAAGVSSAELVLILDDDMEPSPGCLEAHVRAHESGSTLAVLGPIPIHVDAGNSVQQFMAAKWSVHARKLTHPGYALTYRDFYSSNLSIGRPAFIQAGGFDEGFRLYGNEDGELAIRLMASGIRLHYEPAAVAHQHYEKDFNGLARDNISKGRTAVLLAQKHPDQFAQLKLASYAQGSPLYKVVRSGLVAASRFAPFIPKALIRCVQMVGRRLPRHANRLYGATLDQLYWIGAISAMRENGRMPK